VGNFACTGSRVKVVSTSSGYGELKHLNLKPAIKKVHFLNFLCKNRTIEDL
jgi:hypothetical protein